MAKRKNKKNRGKPEAGAPTEEAFEPTEGFGDTGGYTDQFEPIPGGTEGMLTEQSAVPHSDLDELDDVLVLLPEEDEPVSQDSVAFFATESLGDSISEEPLLPITDAGTGEIPLTEDAYGSNSFGVNPTGPTDAVPTMSGTSAVPGSESPTGVEDVGLLAQHPSHGTLPVDGYVDAEELEGGLPDIEDVEDITSLVEEAVAYEMPPPQNDFEDEFLASEEGVVAPSRGGKALGAIMKLAAAVAIVGAGVLYGPGLYEQYFAGQGTGTVASTGGTKDPQTTTTTGTGSEIGATGVSDPVETGTSTDGGTDTTGSTTGGVEVAGTEATTGTTGTTTVSVAQNAARAELGVWMTGVLASNFGTSVPEGR